MPFLLNPFAITNRIFAFSMTDTASSASNAAQYTFSSLDIGAVPSGSDRRFIFVMFAAVGGDCTIVEASTLIGGTMPAFHIKSENEAPVTVASREIPTGTTASMQIRYTSTMVCAGCVVYRVITDSLGFAVFDTASSTSQTRDLSVTTATGGIVLAGAAGRNITTGHSWTGLTEDHDLEINESQDDWISAASKLSAGGALTVSVTSTPIGGDSFYGGAAVAIG